MLKNLTKLTKLSIWGCKVSDLTPLKNLTELTYLGLSYNGQISDLTPLKSLTELRWLSVGGNQIRDITPLTGLTKLTRLWLFQNQISDVTPLESLTKLTELLLNKNPIADLTPLHRLQAKNPGLEIDIEISEEPPSEPDPEVETEGPDLIIESLRVNNTTVATGDRFRLDVVIRNQGKAASGAATLRFYRSSDETISTVDTQVTRSSLPVVAANATRNKWVRLTAPNTAGVYYYGVCVDGIADENDTGNNCSTVVKITVGTPAIDEPPVDATSLAKQVFEKHSRILRRQDVKEVLSNVLTALKDPDIQPLLIPATINLVIADPDFLKKTVPTIPDEFITLLKTDAEIKTLLSDPQVQKLLQMPAAIDELAKLLGISVAPPSTPDGTVVFRDANLANKVREALNLPTGADIPKAKLATLTRLDASVYATATAAEWEKISIKNLTGLEHATQLKTLFLVNHRVSNITPLAGLKKLEVLDLTGKAITDIGPLGGLTNLRILYLTGGGARSRIKDLTPFARLTNLTWLSINGTSFYNNDLIALAPSLAKMKNLEVLNLPYNQISNVTPLASVPSLKRLDLRNNQISDVTPLARLTNLENLWIFGNPITDEAQFQVLLRQNPDLQIYTEDLTSAQLNAPSISVLSAETALLPNYPNPFNPETWIPYRLAKATDVTVTIYDVRGVVVRRLALGHKSAGFYQNRARAAHWDGRNTLGEKVASGLYFYTFTAEDFTATRRMLIRK
ncbi:MAG: leucine-rich repeat domain-containing protein [Candidatus Poribacteria bacterium]|nr:leucine-rich repeat domain-containing protein [Candidatus Poribacteria bacterium]